MGHPCNSDHPRIKANFLSIIFYLYTFETFKRGQRKLWTPDNIYNTINEQRSESLGDEIGRRWTEETKKKKIKTNTPNLFTILFGMFWTELLVAAILLASAQIVLRLAEPVLLGKLLNYFKEEDSINKIDALLYGVYIAVVIGARIIFYNQYKMYTYNTVLRIRVACSTLVYRKVLSLSLNSLQETTSGQIVNFISYDLNRFDSGADLVHFIWVAPIFVLSIIYVLYIETGISGLVGVFWFSLVAVLQSYNGNLTASIYSLLNIKSSNRLRIMNEVIGGIKVIKMYAWEKPFEKLVNSARREELKAVSKLNYVQNVFFSFSSICNHIALFITLFVIISMKQDITSAKVYSLVVYYGILNFIVSIMFILAISKSVEIYKTIKKLNDFLLKEEFVPSPDVENTDGTVIQMDDVEARWNSSVSLQYKNKQKNLVEVDTTAINIEKKGLVKQFRGRTALQHINLSFKQGNLIGVIGPVGSGKSSLLQTLLGELDICSGKIKVQDSLSYASQDSWIFAGTIRENILFGEPFNEARYEEVVRVCCLERDFELFPNGDSTLVGDRGASLSGGQKSRINLARAVYRERNIYLLDDPLSAVDVSVAKHIYQECIEKFLTDKCRILVTHHLYHLRTSDRIIMVNKGSVQDSGTYGELLQRKSIFENTSLTPAPTQIIESKSPILENEQNDIIDNLVDQMKEQSTEDDDEGQDHVTVQVHEDIIQKKHKAYLIIKYFFKDLRISYFTFILLLFSITQAILSSADLFLSGWVNVEEHRNQTNSTKGLKTFHFFLPIMKTEHYLCIYGSLILVIGLFNVLRSVLYVNFFRSNSKRLHNSMFSKVIHGSMEFFDCTPSGQILNRFSRDMQATDEYLPRTIMEALMFINTLLAAIIIVLLLNPFIIIIAVIMGVQFILISYFFMKTSKNIKEVESTLMSPILSHLNETMQGLMTIRGLRAQNIAQNKFNLCLDRYTSSWYMLAVAFATFGFYIEFVSFIFISVVTLSLVAVGKDLGLAASEIGLAITQSMVLSAIVQYGVLNSAQINNHLVSIGRILQYNSISQEEEPVEPEIPSQLWPENGQIIFRNVNLQYSASKPLVLKDLSFIIEPCEKVGIVGRTGAGKSSLLSALFRLSKLSGLIEIDGIDTKKIPLHTLRSKISIIPQDPVLFNGTLRYNLDPFDEYDDSVLYEALRAVELNSGSDQWRKLNARVRDGGSNYSVGQRQLICLARAIVRKNKIVILDEATANVDTRTDMAINETMKKQFSNCTVLTVAHRLSTVMNSDKILVMDAGELIEAGHPYTLLNNDQGKFYSMVIQTGSSMAEELKYLAFQSYQDKLKREELNVDNSS